MRRAWRADERECMPPLIAAARLSPAQAAQVSRRARALVIGARHHEHGGIAALARELALDSPAGMALLPLAEALLRVPDAAGADRLIRDQFAGLDRRAGAVRGPLAWALRVVAALAPASEQPGPRQLAMPLLRRCLRLAMSQLGGQFVFAPTIELALRRARRGAGYRYSFDMLGEAALTDQDARGHLAAYGQALHAVGSANRARGAFAGDGVSVKLSALHPRYGYTQQSRLHAQLLPRLRALALLARRYQIALTIDAEEAERLEPSLELIEALMADAALADWPGLGVAVQAYQKRAPAVIDYLTALAMRRGQPLAVRLVKGAYWDQEIKLAQQAGLSGYPVYTRKVYTDVAYLACAHHLLAARAHLVPQFATHNAYTVAAIVELAGAGAGADMGANVTATASDAAAGMEFQCLHGMGTALYGELARQAARTWPVRIYAPVGARAALLPYLMRRLLENGAGSSFVHRATRASARSLSADPVALAARLGGVPHPRIGLPRDLFCPQRRNSAGIDLADEAARATLLRAIDTGRGTPIGIEPMIAGSARPRTPSKRELHNPADRNERLGTMWLPDERQLEAALQAAVQGAREWGATGIETRARLLERAAELYQQNLAPLAALVVREAGRTLADSAAEVREAIDHLRYYAARIRAEFDPAVHLPLGPVVCISPWNFPLAIFTGQLAAALAAGNAVLAKPAEQASAVAALAVRLLLHAGIPARALQLLPGEGERVGMALVSDARVRGVVFTGSTVTARAIVRRLAARTEVPLIAETGGQNAMIVDSTALPEQVVADVLTSAFNSAGQRCSSLRVLCLQQEIAADVLKMLSGAMRELRVGDPSCISTDVGPLIDGQARARIETHLKRLRAGIRCRSPLPLECARGVYIAPALVEIESIAQLHGEVFGPVLHFLRFERRRLGQLIDAINATGYGLTLGIASRAPGTIAQIVRRAQVGNVYVNRNMIGAVVGVQPFGGQGLSGTGPKSGGPLYLHGMLRGSPGPVPPAQQRAPQLLRELIDWLQGPANPLRAAERERLRQRAQVYARRTLLGARYVLHGYAGESNELRLRPRGLLRGTGRSAAALLEQLAAALATGNALQADRVDLAVELGAALPARLRSRLRGDGGRSQAVLIDAAEAAAHAPWLQQLRGLLAAADGPIVPVILADAREGYPLYRLLAEQTVTVNTAAVGGDPQLLSLTDEEGEDGP
jgi:RHH-type proline utilization regulon transcriptional repressor/proline dehydrogenase/delta 1-pyrroline-5-carboxylate dehydrogenase